MISSGYTVYPVLFHCFAGDVEHFLIKRANTKKQKLVSLVVIFTLTELHLGNRSPNFSQVIAFNLYRTEHTEKMRCWNPSIPPTFDLYNGGGNCTQQSVTEIHRLNLERLNLE
jgi:hypothetical protein